MPFNLFWSLMTMMPLWSISAMTGGPSDEKPTIETDVFAMPKGKTAND
jgi:hypothetical protein